MKKLGTTLVALLALTSAAHATITIGLDAGVLRNALGTSTVPNGALLQLIAYRSPTGTFAAPTATSFLGGDTTNELVVASFAFSQGGAGFVTGETSNLLTITLENTGAASSTKFDAGDQLLLRWYPSLTLASTAPGAGTTYGQYRSSTAADGGLTWFAPNDGSTYTIPNGLNFLTLAAGGSNAETAGYASNVVIGVPEPSTAVLLGAALLGFGGIYFRRRSTNPHMPGV